MFKINGIDWDICFVNPNSNKLRRSDGSLTCGVTDWNDRTVYVSSSINGEFLRKVLAHELVHCFMFSYEIHISIEVEEYIADWISLYGTELIMILDSLMYNFLYRSA